MIKTQFFTKIILLTGILLLDFIGSGQVFGSGVTDIDGNNYQSVIIGSQEWIVENLRVTKYSNGDPIPNITDPTDWSTLATGAWAHYDNEAQHETPFGKLYNGFTVVDTRNLCPSGWHVPNDNDWDELALTLGGNSIAGGKIKSTGTFYWIAPNIDATNETGFTALPGGLRDANGVFGGPSYLGNYGHYWSSTEVNAYMNTARFLWHEHGNLNNSGNDKNFGLSVRCIANNAVSILELNQSTKELIKIVDVLGREVEFIPNLIQIYIYNDGTIERKMIMN